jgi:NADH-quinone oxidoreductase subunit N
MLYAINMFFAALFVLLCSSVAHLLHKNRKISFAINLLALAILIISSLVLFSGGTAQQVFGFFEIYQFSTFFMVVAASLLALMGILAYGFNNYDSFATLIGFIALGIFAVVSANSFITIILGIELLAVPTSFMIFSKEEHTAEAAVKFFIMSSAAIAMIAFGVAMIYPYSPFLSLTGWFGTGMQQSYTVLLSFVLILCGLSFEAALLPFNLWIADVYQGSSKQMPSMLSGINMMIAFAAIIEIMVLSFGAASALISRVLVLVSAVTMLFGNLVALKQKNVKRILIYSSLAQAGYIAVGLASSPSFGIDATIFYMVAYAFTAVGAFAIVSYLEEKGRNTLSDYSGLSSGSLFLSAALTIFMLSMAGIPPLIGFVGKYVVFTGASSSALILLVAFAVINSFISIYYYGKIILEMFSNKRKVIRITVPPSIVLVVCACLLVVILLGIYPQPLLSASYSAAKALSSMAMVP